MRGRKTRKRSLRILSSTLHHNAKNVLLCSHVDSHDSPRSSSFQTHASIHWHRSNTIRFFTFPLRTLTCTPRKFDLHLNCQGWKVALQATTFNLADSTRLHSRKCPDPNPIRCQCFEQPCDGRVGGEIRPWKGRHAWCQEHCRK